MKQFIKKDGLNLLNGGYLSNTAESPVFNAEFVKAQQSADYIINFAKLAKTKNFKSVEADSVADLQKEVQALLNSNRDHTFLLPIAKVEMPITSRLKDEALAFISFQDNSAKTAKINQFMQQFKVLVEFEQFGLFFEEDIVKLNSIYTVKEITDAVTECIDLLS